MCKIQCNNIISLVLIKREDFKIVTSGLSSMGCSSFLDAPVLDNSRKTSSSLIKSMLFSGVKQWHIDFCNNNSTNYFYDSIDWGVIFIEIKWKKFHLVESKTGSTVNIQCKWKHSNSRCCLQWLASLGHQTVRK